MEEKNNEAENIESNILENINEPEMQSENKADETKQLKLSDTEEDLDNSEKQTRPIIGEKLLKNFKMPSFKINWNVRTWPAKIMHTLREYKRVILVSKKPDMEELSEISKISAIGILLIGAIGFILQVMFQFFVK